MGTHIMAGIYWNFRIGMLYGYQNLSTPCAQYCKYNLGQV